VKPGFGRKRDNRDGVESGIAICARVIPKGLEGLAAVQADRWETP